MTYQKLEAWLFTTAMCLAAAGLLIAGPMLIFGGPFSVFIFGLRVAGCGVLLMVASLAVMALADLPRGTSR